MLNCSASLAMSKDNHLVFSVIQLPFFKDDNNNILSTPRLGYNLFKSSNFVRYRYVHIIPENLTDVGINFDFLTFMYSVCKVRGFWLTAIELRPIFINVILPLGPNYGIISKFTR